MSLAVGDCVRIKTPEENEAEGRYVCKGSAIDKWQNQMCVVESVCFYQFGDEDGYKLSFVDPLGAFAYPDDCLSDYIWREYQLELNNGSVSAEEYESLLCGENM